MKRVWAAVHGTDDLLVSYDGASLYRPWGLDAAWRAPAMNLHVDVRHHTDPATKAPIPDGCARADLR